jgi:hypothetical protein
LLCQTPIFAPFATDRCLARLRQQRRGRPRRRQDPQTQTGVAHEKWKDSQSPQSQERAKLGKTHRRRRAKAEEKLRTLPRITSIAKAVPDHLLLTETDNPGAVRWLKKNDEIGMPTAIKRVIEAVSELRQSTPDKTESSTQTNFCQLIASDPWLYEIRRRLLRPIL